MPSVNPINIFVSYANVPADRESLESIITLLHLLIQDGKIDVWDDSRLRGGEYLHEKIKQEIERADMFLLLLSPDFFRSDYIYKKELPLIFEKENQRRCPVIPIYLRYCSWEDDERISNKAIIPKKLDEPLRPVEFWEKTTEALSIVNEKIREILSDLFKNKPLTQIDQVRQISPTLDTIWQEIPFVSEGWGIVRTVDCDRVEDYAETLLDDFLKWENDNRNLIYFISACETQNPESLAKRLVYELRDEKFITCPYTDPDKDEIPVHDLIVGALPERTWGHFWRAFNEAYSIDYQDFKEFIPHAETFTKPHHRISFFCRVKENNWARTPNLETHLQLIIERFATLPSACHKFVLFFIFEFEKLHEYYHDADAKCIQRLQRIASITLEGASTCIVVPHIKLISSLQPVKEDEVIRWLKDLIDKDRLNKPKDVVVRQIIRYLVNQLDDSELKMYEEQKVFNMQRLEIMQRNIYRHKQHVSQLKNPHQIA